MLAYASALSAAVARSSQSIFETGSSRSGKAGALAMLALVTATASFIWIEQPRAQTSACADFLYFQSGRRLEAISVDASGRMQGRQVTTIGAVKDVAGGLEAELQTVSFDTGNMPVKQTLSAARCKSGELVLNLSSGLSGAESKTGDPVTLYLRYPTAMAVGQALDVPPAFELTDHSQGYAMDVVFALADRRVESEAEVTFQGKQMRAFRIRSGLNITISVVGLPISMDYQIVEYFVPAVGVVRTETYDKDQLIEASEVRPA